ncbi:MAG: hypothetical protein LKE54_03715 [Prevotella sp.]|jgi:hypothetical protein|nr:hypothetical protein [Prevotella sp.]MCH3994154.1 hypothetical protein [Prevotella sp.]
MFDAIDYFTKMTKCNKLCKAEGFIPVTISNPDNLEGLLNEYEDNDRFIAISDTNAENLTSEDGTYGFTNGRAFTVMILSSYEYPDMDDRQKQLDLCRTIFKQFVSKIIKDKYTYKKDYGQFETRSIPKQELGRYYLSGMTGLFFTLYTKEPVDLTYNQDEWEETN